ncbi:hypothetical protein [Erwinia sp. MYb416]|uniref:hypothetical protein n=1 Tax=Erwinia sp. MYb416 TaxID=3108532 RepID=UPI0030A60F5C
MKGLLASEVSADLTMLMEGFSMQNRIVPSASDSFKLSAVIPLTALFMSFISASVVYFTGYNPVLTLNAFVDYFLTDGWIFIAPTLVVGLLFTFMAYSNLLLYLAIPQSFRKRSLVVQHLKKVAKRIAGFFVLLMMISTLLSGYSTWFAFAVSGLLFALLFIINLVVVAEINRLGAGIAVEKINKLISKI